MITVDGVVMVDVREAAELVGRTPETVRRWVWSGRIDAVKHGNKLLVRRDVLLELAGQRHAGGGGSNAGLAEWAEKVRRSRRGRAASSASDLVLEDRAAREERAAGAGR